jgi:hypothetical protein
MGHIGNIEQRVISSASPFAGNGVLRLLQRTIFWMFLFLVFSPTQVAHARQDEDQASEDSDGDAVDSDIDPDHPTDADIIKLIDRLMKFRTGDAPIIRALKIFENNCSREVLEYLGMLLDEEMGSGSINERIVSGALNLFGDHGHKNDAELLKEFRSKIYSLTKDRSQRDPRVVAFAQRTWESLQRIDLMLNTRSGQSKSVHASMPLERRSTLSDLMGTEPKDSPSAKLQYFSQVFLNDEIRWNRKQGRDLKVYSRDELADKTMDVIIRRKDRLPILVGEFGVGREKTLYRFAQKILDKEYPKSKIHEETFGDAEVIVISTEKIEKHNAQQEDPSNKVGIKELQNWANMVQQRFRRRIVLVLPDYQRMALIHTPNGDVVDLNMLELPVRISSGLEVPRKADLGSDRGFGYVPMVFTLPDWGYKAISDSINKHYRGKFELLTVPALPDADLVSILKDQWVMDFSQRYGVKIASDALELSVKNAQRLFPDDSKVHAAIKVLQDVVIATLRAKTSPDGQQDPIPVTRKSVSEFIGKRLGVPVDPSDVIAIQTYKDELKAAMNSVVVGQKRMVNDTVDVFVSLFQDSRRPVRSAMLMGPTGVGKTLLAKNLAAKAFRNSGAVLELQGSAIQEKEQLWTYFGAGNGYISSERTKGILCDWLDDPSKGKYGGVIVIDEAEKACGEFFTRLMEFLDNGVVVCGDGKPRFARNHMVLFTSNRAANLMFPPTISNWSNAEIDARLGKLTSEELKKYFQVKTSAKDEKRLPIEILQRINLFTAGVPMNRENTLAIILQTARDLESRAKIEDGLELSIDSTLVEQFVDSRDYKSIGVRPIQSEFEDFIMNYKT